MILNGETVEKINDEELCMLEQLTYLDEDVAIAAGLDKRSDEDSGNNTYFAKINKAQHGGRNIGYILKDFD